MVDPATAMAGISAALALMDQVVKLAGSVGDTKNKAALLELQTKLGEAQGKIAQVVISLTEQAAENHRIQSELFKAQDALKAAQAQLTAKSEMKIHDNVWWVRGDPNPICMVCKGKDTPLLRHRDSYSCRICRTNVGHPQPPPDFGIPPIIWPPPPPPEPPYESEFERARR